MEIKFCPLKTNVVWIYKLVPNKIGMDQGNMPTFDDIIE